MRRRSIIICGNWPHNISIPCEGILENFQQVKELENTHNSLEYLVSASVLLLRKSISKCVMLVLCDANHADYDTIESFKSQVDEFYTFENAQAFYQKMKTIDEQVFIISVITNPGQINFSTTPADADDKVSCVITQSIACKQAIHTIENVVTNLQNACHFVISYCTLSFTSGIWKKLDNNFVLVPKDIEIDMSTTDITMLLDKMNQSVVNGNAESGDEGGGDVGVEDSGFDDETKDAPTNTVGNADEGGGDLGEDNADGDIDGGNEDVEESAFDDDMKSDAQDGNDNDMKTDAQDDEDVEESAFDEGTKTDAQDGNEDVEESAFDEGTNTDAQDGNEDVEESAFDEGTKDAQTNTVTTQIPWKDILKGKLINTYRVTSVRIDSMLSQMDESLPYTILVGSDGMTQSIHGLLSPHLIKSLLASSSVINLATCDGSSTRLFVDEKGTGARIGRLTIDFDSMHLMNNIVIYTGEVKGISNNKTQQVQKGTVLKFARKIEYSRLVARR